MDELARHIEMLLLENDCVIVPELGGFIAHYESAHYDAAEHIYYPPKRTIGFNSKLIINDGLLVQCYMQTYHTDFPDATRKIKQEAEAMKDRLHREGSVAIPRLGKLCCNIHDVYEFHPSEEELATPSLYQLDSLYIRELDEAPPISAKTIPFVRKQIETRQERKAVPVRWIGKAVAVAAAIVLFFFLSTPVENTYTDDGNYASLETAELVSAIKTQSLAMNVIAPKGAEKQPSVPRKPASAATEKAPEQGRIDVNGPNELSEPAVTNSVREPVPERPTAATMENTPRYHIVIASLETMAGAQAYIEAHQQKEEYSLSIREGNGHFRIVLCSFDEEPAAYKKLNEFKRQDVHPNAWVFASK